MEIKIVIYEKPIPQGRPRFARAGKYVHAYDPEKSKNYKQLVRFWVTQQIKKIDGFKPFQTALCVDITFYLGIPSSWSKKRRVEADSGIIRPIVKPDTDNLVKSVTDSCNKLLWKDDSVITDLHARKRYTAGQTRVEMVVREVE